MAVEYAEPRPYPETSHPSATCVDHENGGNGVYRHRKLHQREVQDAKLESQTKGMQDQGARTRLLETIAGARLLFVASDDRVAATNERQFNR